MAEVTDDHIKILVRNRFTIVQQLQVERSFLFDYLLSKNVFDRDDYDTVRSEKTREQKAAKVLDIIETKGQHGFNHFKDALQLLNPSLYETLTGEKATTRDSPIFNMTDFLDSGDGLPRPIDQDILSSHLKRVTDDLRDMTLRYNSILKENQQYRKVAHQSTRDKNELANRIEVLEMMLTEAEAVASKTCSDASYTLMSQYDTIQKDRHANKDFIIQLQMKLLQSQEKYEEKTRQLDECTMKYKKLENELFKVNENYTFQRSETKKLSATLKTRTEEAKYCDELKKQSREKQFKIMELQSDLDDREKEIEQIKNWTTALKQRYDTVLQERNEIMAKQHETVENLSLSQNNITDMDIKVKRLNREILEVKKERDKLESENTMLKNRVTSEHNAYVKMTEKIEELKTYFNELIETKEKELTEKKEYVEYLQEEVEDLKKDLAKSREELTAALNTNDSLTCELRKLRSQHNLTVESLEQQLSAWEKSCEDGEDTEEDEKEEEDKIQDHIDSGACCKSAIRRLSTADLLKSIRRRFQSSLSQPNLNQKEKVQFVKSHSADSSSQRESQFKIRTLPYDALACMYSGNTEDNTALLRSTLPGFYERERMQHARKTSSPLPLSVCDARYLNSIAHESLAEHQELENQGNTGTEKTTGLTKDSDRSDAAFRPRSQVVRRHSDISHTKNSTTLKSLCKPIDDCM